MKKQLVCLFLIINFSCSAMHVIKVNTRERYNDLVIQHPYVVTYLYQSALLEKNFCDTESKKLYREEQKKYSKQRREIISNNNKVIKRIAIIPRYAATGVTFLVADLKDIPSLREEYGIKGDDTLVLIKKGAVRDIWRVEEKLILQKLQNFIEGKWQDLLDKKIEQYQEEQQRRLEYNAAQASAVAPYMWGGYPYTPYCFDGPFCGYASIGIGTYF